MYINIIMLYKNIMLIIIINFIFYSNKNLNLSFFPKQKFQKQFFKFYYTGFNIIFL